MGNDHLHHFPAIGAYIGVKADAARHLAKAHGLPVFYIGKTAAASKAEIDEWLKRQREKPRAPKAGAAA